MSSYRSDNDNQSLLAGAEYGCHRHHLPRFNFYSELTQLQVNGARDRSRRSMEKSDWERKLSKAQERWQQAVDVVRRKHHQQRHHQQQQPYSRSLLEERKEEAELRMFHEAVEEALNNVVPEGEERKQATLCLSPFLRTRLAVVLRKEYHVSVLDKALDNLYQEQKSLVNWVCHVVQTSEDEKKESDTHHKRLLQQIKLEMETNRLEYILQCQRQLELQRQEILRVLHLKMEKIREEESREQIVIVRPSIPTKIDNNNNNDKNNNQMMSTIKSGLPTGSISSSSKWLEEMINEDYFVSIPSSSSSSTSSSFTTIIVSPASGGDNNNNNNGTSDWVMCGF